jgi:hypothetical protein
MAKTLVILLLPLVFLLSQSNGKVKVVYKEGKPENISELTFYKKQGKDYLDRAEIILKEAEKDLVLFAKEKKAIMVEIYILEQEHGEIPTESQMGKKGFVSMYFCLKNPVNY